MNAEEFREFGKAAVDFIADYLENVRERPVLPSVEPGYMRSLLSENAPQESESWKDVMADMERVIMPGMTHWQSPQFHSFYPVTSSYPSIVGELLSAGTNCISFTWMSSPACTELEVITLDWLGKMLDLPAEFLACSGGKGGGVIQGTASESTLVCLLAAREKTLKKVLETNPDLDEGTVRDKLILYTSAMSHSSVEKAGTIAAVRVRMVPTNSEGQMIGAALKKSMQEDRDQGLIPCYVVATIGTTISCAFDFLHEIGVVCKEEGIWLHVDAAYAGAAFICPEYRHHMAGVHLADSFNFNPHKWLLVNFDCSALWLKNSQEVIDVLGNDPSYLRHSKEGAMPDFRNWQIPLGRRFRALKLWFVLRIHGVRKLQDYIRHTIALAQQFEALVHTDPRLEVVSYTGMGLVCFRVKGPDHLTDKLLADLQESRKIYLIGSPYLGRAMIRFVVGSSMSQLSDMQLAWAEIQSHLT